MTGRITADNDRYHMQNDKKLKAFFFDIDGTLVSFATHRIPGSAVQAIAKAHSMGHKIVISTGRPTAIITNLGQLQQLGLVDAYITMNGAYCYCGDKVLYSNPIDEEDARLIAGYAMEQGKPCVFVGEHDMSIAGENEEAMHIFGEDLAAPSLSRTDYDAPLAKPLYQITPFFTDEQQRRIESQLKSCEMGRWHPAFVDVTAKGCTKAKGLDVVLDYFGMSIGQAVAFGDGGNDVPMLRHAGLGIAMGNANDEVKSQADRVTTSIDDNGIANAMAQIL